MISDVDAALCPCMEDVLFPTIPILVRTTQTGIDHRHTHDNRKRLGLNYYQLYFVRTPFSFDILFDDPEVRKQICVTRRVLCNKLRRYQIGTIARKKSICEIICLIIPVTALRNSITDFLW